MATDTSITDLTESTDVLDTDILPVVSDPSGSPETRKATKSNFLKEYTKTASLPVKASGAEVTAGTNDAKFVTPKALSDAAIVVTPVKATGEEVNVGTNDAKFLTPKAVTDSNLYTYKSHMIYTLGDSITLGFGATQYNDIQRELGRLLGSLWKVNNNGVSGNTTAQMLARLNTDILDHGDAEYVVVWGGINDAYQAVAEATTEANLQAIYTAIHNAGAKVISLNISPSKSNAGWSAAVQTRVDTVNTWIASTATNIDYKIDVYTTLEDVADTLNAAYDGGDGLHINTVADIVVGKLIYTTVGTAWPQYVTLDDPLYYPTREELTAARLDGWTPCGENWAYSAATQIYTDHDARDKYAKGDKITFVQIDGGVPLRKFFYVTSVTYSTPNTTINLTGGTDYTVTNVAVREGYFSKQATPRDFPQWFNFTPTISGSTGSIGTFAATTQMARFAIISGTAHVQSTSSISNVGSWTGNLQYLLPVYPSANADNAVQLITQGAILTNGSLAIEGWCYDMATDTGIMRFVSSFNSTIYPYSSLGVSDVVVVNAIYEI